VRTRTLRDGTPITELGLGTAQLGNLYRETTEKEARSAVEVAWEAGVRYFDTAPHYGIGLSERRIGALLREVPRDQVLVSTKAGRLLVPNPGDRSQPDDHGFAVPAETIRRWDFSAAGIRRSLEESLDRLGLDRVDIVYLHDPDAFGDQVLAESIPALVEMRDAGLVRAIGVGMNQSALPTRFVAESDIDVVMLAGRYTLLEQGALADLLPVAESAGVRIVIAGVFNSGLLATDDPGGDARYNYSEAPPDLIERARQLAAICREHGTTLPAAAIGFPLRHPAVASVVVGARTGAQVEENVERYAADIPESLWAALDEAGFLGVHTATGHANSTRI
jgi:D-threo-aldose 1-dehydrogenase